MTGIQSSHYTDDAICGKPDDFYLEQRFTFYKIWQTEEALGMESLREFLDSENLILRSQVFFHNEIL